MMLWARSAWSPPPGTHRTRLMPEPRPTCLLKRLWRMYFYAEAPMCHSRKAITLGTGQIPDPVPVPSLRSHESLGTMLDTVLPLYSGGTAPQSTPPRHWAILQGRQVRNSRHKRNPLPSPFLPRSRASISLWDGLCLLSPIPGEQALSLEKERWRRDDCTDRPY